MILEEYAKPINSIDARRISERTLVSMYRTMLRIRMVEERIADLVVQEEIRCPCHLYIGQEAVATGVCASLAKEDFVLSTHRSHGHYLAKGGPMRALMAELYGKATGCSRGRGGSMHLVAPELGLPGSSAMVGGTIPIAVGMALASQIRDLSRISVAFFGDGAVNEGVFYESLNLAALKRLPVVFICENNFYSTHMPISAVHADPEIHKKAAVFQMSGTRIDGNNVVEVFQAAQGAVEKARTGGGPTLLECVTYRWRGHVGANWDLDKPIRPREEVMWWVKNCPLKRFERVLLTENLLSGREMDQMVRDIEEEIDDAVRFAQESPYPDVSELRDDVFMS
jgi:pyruvate dehydrogenase E1 component alpha subunit